MSYRFQSAGGRFQPSGYSARANQDDWFMSNKDASELGPTPSEAASKPKGSFDWEKVGQFAGAAAPGIIQGAVRAAGGGKKRKGKKPSPPAYEPPPEEAPIWPWILGGVLVLGVAGGGLFLATRPAAVAA